MLRRHDLLRIRPDGWAQILAASSCVQRLADESRRLLRGWAERSWPVIVRRRTAEESETDIAVGLPLPPACGKLRLAFSIPPTLWQKPSPPFRCGTCGCLLRRVGNRRSQR
ncbi:MAG: malonate decarboxylase holo-[acyl-carrier-protein] synthase [Rhodospirillales bacterium]